MRVAGRRGFFSRRGVALWVVGACWALPGSARAQQAGRHYRLGWVGTTAPDGEPYNRAFVSRLAELGFVAGRNLSMEYRDARVGTERLNHTVAELERMNCDVIFAPGTELYLRAVEKATRDVPIVIVSNDYDPVATGHVTNMARPGGRITGVSQLQVELPAKRLEVMKELLPRARRVGVLADVSTAGQLAVTRQAAGRLGFELVVHEFAQSPYDLGAAFDAFVRGRADAMVALPSMFNNYLWAEAGGLISYGPNFSASYSRAAELVAKILNGARPAEMPIEQPNAVEMVVNVRTAKALGISVPVSIQARADRVIE
jgi:putative ABC transport system substrate-binding protein